MLTLCYIDAFSGLSGDMFVGALADAGAEQRAIADAIHSLNAGAQVSFERTKRRGMGALKFSVKVGEEAAHRHLPDILEMVEAANLPGAVKLAVGSIFRKLGEAEAGAHQVSIDKVHFHEVGAVDSIADIVGAALGFHLLGADRIICSPINTGSGTVKTEHGVLPVPAPATAALLMGKPVYARGPALELTTPTGAAVVCALASEYGSMPAMTISSIGYGAGDKDFREHANILRVMVGSASGAAEATTVTVIEANIDDSSPEVMGYAVERLLEAGALDASIQAMTMKKSRPGFLLRVIARPEKREELASIVFAETSTLGVRMFAAERRVQQRRFVRVETAFGTVSMKVAADGSYAPEYDDCRNLALASGVALKQVMAAANISYSSQAK